VTISRQDAAAALREVESAQQRTLDLRGYERGAPHLFLWGVIWIVGYAASYFLPTLATPVWIALNVLGVAGSFWIGRRNGTRSRYQGRFGACVSAILIFVVATYYVLRPRDPAQLGAYPALVVALGYALAGIWGGGRWIVAGSVLAGLTLLGFGLMHHYFMLWMAAVGGGSLLLSGLWLRRS
jgi:hypothetical protein